jgi:hypothetical protein
MWRVTKAAKRQGGATDEKGEARRAQPVMEGQRGRREKKGEGRRESI